VTVDGWYSLPAVQDSGTIYRLWTDGAASQQYFLVENRRRIGCDIALPGQGTLIWHVDDNVSGNDNQWYPGHTSSGHYQVALEQADGLWEIEKNLDAGDAGDPYPGSTGNRFFNVGTTPDSKSYAFIDTECAVDSIPNSADQISVFLRMGNAPQLPPTTLAITRGPGNVRLSWTPVAGATHYDIYRNLRGYFQPVGPPWQTVAAPTTHLDVTSGIGDPSTNYFFRGRARSASATSPFSNTVGEFEFGVPSLPLGEAPTDTVD
jgi:hypothetical protein